MCKNQCKDVPFIKPLLKFCLIFAEYEIISIASPQKLPVITSTSAVFLESPDQLHCKTDPSMMALHNGSKVYVKKADILKIFCDKPGLYSGRLATLIFGEKTLRYSCMPEERDEKYHPLNEEILDSIISKYCEYDEAYFQVINRVFNLQLTLFKFSSSKINSSTRHKFATSYA